MIKFLAGLLVTGILLVGMFVSSQPVSAGTGFDDVASNLSCQCGCRMVLNACDMKECSVQRKMSDQVKYLIDQGQGKEQIIDYFVNTYGEEVLAAPTKKGFNLTAWLTPFAAIAAGLGFVYLILDQWVLRRGRASSREEEVVEEVVAPAERARYEERLRRELERYEGGA